MKKLSQRTLVHAMWALKIIPAVKPFDGASRSPCPAAPACRSRALGRLYSGLQ